MPSENNLNSVFTDIANAIRNKKGSVDLIKPINMADEISTIETGGGSTDFTIKDFITLRGSTAYLFYKAESLTDEQLASNLKYDYTTGVTNMQNMFDYCSNLTTIPPLNTSKVGIMSYMFNNCSNLITIPPLDTSKVESMPYIFNHCHSLEKIDITKLVRNTSNVANSCYSLKIFIIRTMDTIPTLKTNAFTNCYHFYGTVNATYNPDGLKDGAIYVPDDKVETLKTETNWSVFADIIKPLSTYVE